MRDAPPLVLIGVTGGVAAYKTCEVVRRLVEAGRDVRCALTHDAERFIGPQLLAALTRKPVLDNRPVLDGTYPHLDAARDAAVVCIAPCTANTLAKLSWGLADNVVTQSALSTPAPLLIAPAMNVRMWEHPATQANARACASAASPSSARGRARSPRASRASGAWRSRPRSSRRSRPCSARGDRGARGPARARDRRRDARAARRRALPRQPLVRAAWAPRSRTRPAPAVPRS